MILYDKGSTIGTAEGTTFTLQDTAKDRLLRFLKYDGNTTQTQTDGKNIAGVTSVSGYLSLSGDILTLGSGAYSTSYINIPNYTFVANQTYSLSLFILKHNSLPMRE